MKISFFALVLIFVLSSFSLYSSEALTADQIKRQEQLTKQYQFELDLAASKVRQAEALVQLQEAKVRASKAVDDSNKLKQDLIKAKQENLDAQKKLDAIKQKRDSKSINSLLGDTASNVNIKTKTVVYKSTDSFGTYKIVGVVHSQKIPDMQALELNNK